MNTVTRSVGNKRLLALADFLDALDPERFDYNHWVGDDWKGAKDLSCGTTACALGWATAMPRFQRLGLHLDKDFEVRDSNGEWGTVAAANLFGITLDESFGLFSPDNDEEDATPQYVAQKIRDLVVSRS